MKHKLILIILVIFCLSSLTRAQSSEKVELAKHLVFVEVGGYGGYGSVNYEYLVKKVNNFKFSARVGLSTYHLYDYTNSLNPDIIIPIGINGSFGSNHNVDFGIGQTISSTVSVDKLNYKTKRNSTLNTNFSIGYRYQKEAGGILFKMAYSPIIEENKIFTHWALVAVGFSF